MAWTASDFERLDPKLFRGFLAVVKTGSFSEAAKHAHLTQGAISQQVAKLEDRLGSTLFVRGSSGLQLTSAGKLLAEFANHWLESSTALAERINREAESMAGQVSYSMPESCIHSPHFGMLLEQRAAYPEIRLSIQLKPSADVYADLQRGDVDFGFVTDKWENEQIEFYPFCVEEYVLVGSPSLHLMPNSVEALRQMPFIAFPGVEKYIASFTQAHFPGAPVPALSEMDVRGSFNDIRGALAMVRGGLGAAILPSHVVGEWLEQGHVQQHQPSDGHATQQIYIVRMKQRFLPARVRRVVGWFLSMHADLQPVPQQFLE